MVTTYVQRRESLLVFDVSIVAWLDTQVTHYLDARPCSVDAVLIYNERVVPKASPQSKQNLHQKIPLVLLVAGVVLFICGLYLLTGFNKSTPQNVPTSTLVPETAKPSTNDIDDHRVAADLPRTISIPSGSITARVFAVGTDQLNRIASPTNVYDVGWFNQSSKPGQPGVMVMNGHVSSSSTPGVFFNLKNLKAGDKIYVEQGDGSLHSFSVKENTTYDFDKVDMLKVLRPITANKLGLNLITCAGKVINGGNEFDKRVVVFAEQD